MPIVYAILSGILYGTLGFFGTRLEERGLHISEFLALRFTIASLLVAALMIVRRIPFNFNRDAMKLMAISALFYATSTELYFIACHSLGTGVSMVLFFCYPVTVILLMWGIDRLSPSLSTTLALSSMLIGLPFLVDLSEFNASFVGLVIGVAAAALYGTYFYLSKRYVKKLSILPSVFWVCTGSSLSSFLTLFSEEVFTWEMTSGVVVDAFLLALVSTVLPLLFVFKAFEKLESSQASLLSVCEPVVTLLLGFAFLGEKISWIQGMGVLLVLMSVALIRYQKKETIQNQQLE